MPHVFNFSAMAESIHKQLMNITNSEITQKQIYTSVEKALVVDLLDYNTVKKFNGELHRYLKELDISIGRTILLNIVSKALGYANHHHLKHSFGSPSDTTKETRFIGAEHPLSLFFQERDEIALYLKSKGVSFSAFAFTGGKRELALRLMGISGSYDISSKTHREIASYFESKGILIQRNLLLFPIAYKEENPEIACAIVKKYKAFFYPNWRIRGSKFESVSVGEILPVSFHDPKVIANDMFAVGDLACDMPWKTTIAVLNTMLFMDGGLKEFDTEILQALIGIKKLSSSLDTTRLSNKLDIVKREEYLIKKQIGAQSIDEVMKKHRNTNFIFTIKEPERQYVEYIENHTKRSIGKTIRMLTEEIYGQQITSRERMAFDFKESMSKKCFELCGISYDELLEHDDKLWHHDMRKTIQHLLMEATKHVEYFYS